MQILLREISTTVSVTRVTACKNNAAITNLIKNFFNPAIFVQLVFMAATGIYYKVLKNCTKWIDRFGYVLQSTCSESIIFTKHCFFFCISPWSVKRTRQPLLGCELVCTSTGTGTIISRVTVDLLASLCTVPRVLFLLPMLAKSEPL